MSQQSLESDSELRIFDKPSFNALLQQLGPEDSDVINSASVVLNDSQQTDALQQEYLYQRSHTPPQIVSHTQQSQTPQVPHTTQLTPMQQFSTASPLHLQCYNAHVASAHTSSEYYTPSVVSEARSPTRYTHPVPKSESRPQLFFPRSQANPSTIACPSILSPVSLLSPVQSPHSQMISPDSHAVPRSPLLSPGQGVVQRQTTDGVFEGEFSFSMTIPSKSKITKSMPFIFSEPLNRLYVQMGVQCPVRFKLKHAIDGLFIRAVPMYTEHQNRAHPIAACHVHTDRPADGFSSAHVRSSWMKLGPSTYGAQTLQDSQGHFTLRVPWFVTDNTLEIAYIFVCRNSCIGGPNRRKTSVAFTLENSNGDILGKQVIEVRVISSPGRDREKDERRFLEEEAKERPKLKRGKRVTFNDNISSVSPPKKYYLEMDMKQTYDMLAPIRDSLELTHKFPQSDINRSRKSKPLRCMNTENVGETPARPPPTCPHATSSRPIRQQSSDSPPTAIPDSTQDGMSCTVDNDKKISAWLTTFDFEAYAETFSDAGYINMGQILDFTMKDIDKLRISASHARIMIDNLRGFCGEMPLSQPSGSGEALGLCILTSPRSRLKTELSNSSTSSNED